MNRVVEAGRRSAEIGRNIAGKWYLSFERNYLRHLVRDVNHLLPPSSDSATWDASIFSQERHLILKNMLEGRGYNRLLNQHLNSEPDFSLVEYPPPDPFRYRRAITVPVGNLEITLVNNDPSRFDVYSTPKE